MATSKVNQGFIPKLETDYTNFFTPGAGVTITGFWAEQIDNNVIAIYIAGTITNALAGYDRVTIGEYTGTLFGFTNVSGYTLADLQATGDTNHYLGKISIGSTGYVILTNHSNITCNTFITNGLIYRRITA